MDSEVALATGYATFLLVGAVGLDRLARHAHMRADRYRTAGFRYHPQHDAWVCPQDEWLWPAEFDHHRRLVRYRAKPSVCNACPVKGQCTTSPDGREVVRAVDPWPHSEAGRFHRGLALMLVGLAGLILGVELARHHTPVALALLAVPVAFAGMLGWRFLDHRRHTPTGFPDPTPSTGLRLTARGGAATTGIPASRTRWGSDRSAHPLPPARTGTRWKSR